MQGQMSSLSRVAHKKLKALLTLKGRQKHGLFLAEGIRVLEESCKFRFWPQSVYIDENGVGERGERLVAAFARSGCEIVAITGRELYQLAESVTPQGIIAVYKIPALEVEHQLSQKDRLILYLDNISDPGNVGTLIRSALAFEVDLVVLSPATVDPFNGKVIRSSAGTIFGQKTAVGDIDELLKISAKNSVLLGAQRGGEVVGRALKNVKSGQRLIFAVGSEARGLSKECLARVRQLVGIVHNDKVESLNAAVAGSIILKDIHDLLHGVKHE